MMEYDGSFEPITTMKTDVSFSITEEIVDVVENVHV
jgi:hypothetical protein